MTTFFNTFAAPDVIDDPAVEADQIEEYASQFAEPLEYGPKSKLKEACDLAREALLILSCLKLKGKNRWGVDGLREELLKIKTLEEK